MTDKDLSAIRKLIRKYGLANAVRYDGKADAKAVVGKLLAERPDLRSKVRDLMELVNESIDQINALSSAEQMKELQSIAPELIEYPKEQKEKELPPLVDAEIGKVVTRLPPEPSGYPHIGHAYAGYINWYYAQKYKGQLILRFEDTNPRTVREEYYEAFREGYQWMEIDWDRELKVSDDLPHLYERAHELIEQNKAYMCQCPVDHIREKRRIGQACQCRTSTTEDNLAIWDSILEGKYREGEIVVRLRIDMQHINAVMRDPNIFRIIEHPHPFQKDRYRLWPTYDFAVALEDHLNGISHILRSSEFATRGELQSYIRSLFEFPQPHIQEFSRFSIEGTPVSKRKIRPLIEDNIISGWDDIRLTTLAALRRRGIIPETIREITREVGMSIAQPIIDWSVILGINRRLVDSLANRYFYVSHPVPVKIHNTKPRKAELPLHPDFKDRGSRLIPVKSHVYIDGHDAAHLKIGDVFRLKHLYNIQVEKKRANGLDCRYVGEEINQADLKIQWVTDEAIAVELQIPDVLYIDEKLSPDSLKKEEGLGEKTLKSLQRGTLIQLERKGFGRIDRIEDKISINMTG